MEKMFDREISALDDVFGFVDSFLEQHDIDESAAFSTRLTVEELFTNLVRHNAAHPGHIPISLEKEADRLVIRLKDLDVEPFDPSKLKPVDINQPLQERTPGRLGIHLVNRLVDELNYKYLEDTRTLCVTAIKYLEAKNV